MRPPARREVSLERIKLRGLVLSETNNPRIWIPSTCDIGSGSMPNSKDKKPRGRQRKKADFNFTRKEKRSDLEEHSPSEPDQIRPGQPAQPVRFSSLPTAPSRNCFSIGKGSSSWYQQRPPYSDPRRLHQRASAWQETRPPTSTEQMP